jgi:hypothetical protein
MKEAVFGRTLGMEAIRLRGVGRITLAAVGFVGVLGASFNGGSFLNYHEDFSSMLMAVGFALATATYVALSTRCRHGRPPAPAAAETRSE